LAHLRIGSSQANYFTLFWSLPVFYGSASIRAGGPFLWYRELKALGSNGPTKDSLEQSSNGRIPSQQKRRSRCSATGREENLQEEKKEN
jgi:hypothetical protein